MDKGSCLERKLVFDPKQTYCQWTDPSCGYRDPTITPTFIFVSLIIVFLVTEIISYPIDVLLDILKITTSSEGELSDKGIAELNSNIDATENDELKIDLFRPDAIVQTSRDSVKVLIPSTLDKFQLLKKRRLKNCLVLLTYLKFDNSILEFIIDHYCNLLDSSSDLISSKVTNDLSVFLRLIFYQHQVFRNLRIDSIADNFERLWGIQSVPPSHTLNIESLDGVNYQIDENMRTALVKHLVFVNSSVECLSLKYKKCENYHEVDLFYRFILDLLGKSDDGEIFQKKLENESEEERSYSIFSKIFAGLMILALNIFFCTYVILKGYVKGLTWQLQYLNLCIFQLVTEVFVFSSVECVLLHFTLPSLAFDAVQKVLSTITNLVDELLETEVVSDPLNMLCIFNAPQYLFVSSRLALQFPHSLESVLISSYNTCVPTSVLEMIGVTNELVSNKLSGDKNKRNLWKTFKSYCKRLGTTPFFLQRLAIRLVQPIVLTGVTTLFSFVNLNAIYSAGIFVLLIILILVIWYFTIQFRQTTNRTVNASVIPIIDFRYIFDDKVTGTSGSDDNSDNEVSSSSDVSSPSSSNQQAIVKHDSSSSENSSSENSSSASEESDKPNPHNQTRTDPEDVNRDLSESSSESNASSSNYDSVSETEEDFTLPKSQPADVDVVHLNTVSTSGSNSISDSNDSVSDTDQDQSPPKSDQSESEDDEEDSSDESNV